MVFSRIKYLLKKLPIALSKNHKYDLLTKQILKKHCSKKSNCVDVGTHTGEIFDLFLKYSPQGVHFGFEPIPALHNCLLKKYQSFSNCTIYALALSNKKECSPFNYVISNSAYSGIKKRKYDRKNESDTLINVQTDLLDNIIPPGLAVDFIKIDVEGGEMDVLEGAKRIISFYHPLIIFECGIGGSDVYGTTPEKMFSFFSEFVYKIFLLDAFLKKNNPLSLKGFCDQFYRKKNYYFVAY